MKYLHITNTDKFIEPYIKFINLNFYPKEHQFLCFSTGTTNYIKSKYDNVILNEKVLLNVKLLKYLYITDRIYLHNIFNMRILILLFFQPWLLKKCYWIVWGGDLYAYKKSRSKLKYKIFELIRAFIIKRLGGLITHIKGDYELAKKWYGVGGKYYYSFMYPSNLYKEISINKKAEDDIVYLQVGNSADPSNNHLDVFEKLRFLNTEKMHIICPLSYGDKEYAEKVMKRGKEIFDNRFEPLLDFISFDKYLEILSKIDIAIFNHKRQQAVGNITTLLGLGKKVYIRDDITTWKFCETHGLKVYSVNSEFQDIFEPITYEVKNENIKKIKEQFSEAKLVSDWENIFEGN